MPPTILRSFMSKPQIYFIREQLIMLDQDVAEFYGVEVRVLNQAMRRKQEFFDGLAFQLTRLEYKEILSLRDDLKLGKYLPVVYTEKAAYQMAIVLDSKTGLKVAKLILDVFMAYKQGSLIPAHNNDNRVLQIEHRLTQVERDLKGVQAIQHFNFNAPVGNFIQNSTLTQNIQNKDELVVELAKILIDNQVSQNKELVKLLTQTMSKAHSGDKKGMLENLKTVLDIGSSMSTITTSIPAIMSVITKLF